MNKHVFKLHDSIHGDINFARVYPVWSRFVLPGDVWKISSNLLIRYMPLRTPPLTQSDVRVRFGFVPLRLIEENTELIITGSKNGNFKPDREIPKFRDIYEEWSEVMGYITDGGIQTKGSLADWIYGLPQITNFSMIDFIHKASSPAAYWLKAFSRFLFDYYRDENFSEFDDFEEFYKRDVRQLFSPDVGVTPGPSEDAQIFRSSNFFSNLRKDGYFTSALPWQLKGIAPTIGFSGAGFLDFSNSSFFEARLDTPTSNLVAQGARLPFGISPGALGGSSAVRDAANESLRAELSKGVLDASAGFTMAQFREMAAMTRIFERLARTGSRYTEYLQANFGIAPSDGTLQRAQYLGGYKIPIVTTEVLQTGEGSDPVGTMRGHGITNGGDRIHTFTAKEFGIIVAMLDVRPRLEWTQGVDREKTYKARWDFYNPSFANLSEQEIRNGEVYYAPDGENDGTFGFVPYGQELRTSRTRMAGEMRGNLADWNQAITFGARPRLNQAFLNGVNYGASWTRPFVVQSGENPMILDFAVNSKVVRPLVKHAVPGLVDHH